MQDKEKEQMTLPQIKEYIKSSSERYSPKLEWDLVTLFEKFLYEATSKGNRSFKIKREVGVGRRISDLVLFLKPESKNNLYTTPLNAQDAVIVSQIRKKQSLTIDEASSLFGFEKNVDVVQKRLRHLINQNIIIFSNNTLKLQDDWPPFEIIAYEAKLTNWRSALVQAVSYLAFADKSYVVLPEGTSLPALSKYDLFKEAGVGLILVSTDGYSEIIPATLSHNHDWRRDFVASRCNL